MKNIFTAFLLMLSTSTFAVDFTGNLSYTNDYLWIGMSQGNGPAWQTGIDVKQNFGNYQVYAGAWTSEVEFGENNREVDVYAGAVIPIMENLYFDMGYVDYDFNDEQSDFSEWKIGGWYDLSWGGQLLGYLYQTDVESYETKDETATLTYLHPTSLPIINNVKFKIEYTYFQQNETMVMLGMMKELGNGFNFSVMAGEDMMTKGKLVSGKLTFNF